MLRRQFFRLAALVAPAWAIAQTLSTDTMHELAATVLPGSLGRAHTDKAADDFLKWIAEYKEGAFIASGYGHPRTQTVGPNPSRNYAAQLQALGAAFAKGDKRAAVEAALAVASDLLSHFYGSADGEDTLYGLAIKRDECRGLASSPARPAKIS